MTPLAANDWLATFWCETETLGIKGAHFQRGPTLLTSTQDSKYFLSYSGKEIWPFWIRTNSMNLPGPNRGFAFHTLMRRDS